MLSRVANYRFCLGSSLFVFQESHIHPVPLVFSIPVSDYNLDYSRSMIQSRSAANHVVNFERRIVDGITFNLWVVLTPGSSRTHGSLTFLVAITPIKLPLTTPDHWDYRPSVEPSQQRDKRDDKTSIGQ